MYGSGICGSRGLAIVDFTNPAACEWYGKKLEALLDMGVDCFKTDFGERIPIDVVYQDGSEPVSMHNYYAFLYNRCVFELLKEVKGQQEAVVFARSATAGGQQFPVHWEVTAAHLTFPWQRRCVEACPSRLIPSRLADYAEHHDEEKFTAHEGLECMECGSCSYVCPAKRQLKQAIGSMRKIALANRKKK